jgi:hypothetical protein
MRHGRAGPTNVWESTDEGFAEKHICNGDETAEPFTQPASWGRNSEIVFLLKLAMFWERREGSTHQTVPYVHARVIPSTETSVCIVSKC